MKFSPAVPLVILTVLLSAIGVASKAPAAPKGEPEKFPIKSSVGGVANRDPNVPWVTVGCKASEATCTNLNPPAVTNCTTKENICDPKDYFHSPQGDFCYKKSMAEETCHPTTKSPANSTAAADTTAVSTTSIPSANNGTNPDPIMPCGINSYFLRCWGSEESTCDTLESVKTTKPPALAANRAAVTEKPGQCLNRRNRCRCTEHHARNKDGECVSFDDCKNPIRCGDEAHYEYYPRDVDNSCDDIEWEITGGRENVIADYTAHVDRKYVLKPGCRCNEDFVRSEMGVGNSTCVHVSTCKKPKKEFSKF